MCEVLFVVSYVVWLGRLGDLLEEMWKERKKFCVVCFINLLFLKF